METYLNRTKEEVIDNKVSSSGIKTQSSEFMNKFLEIQHGYQIESIASITKMYRIFRDNADQNFGEKSNEERKQIALNNTEMYFKVKTAIKIPSDHTSEKFDDDYL